MGLGEGMVSRVLVLCSLLGSSAVFSQVNQVVSKQKSSNSFFKKVLPDTAGYFSLMAGPSLGGDGDPVDKNGEIQENSMSTWNQIALRWKIPNSNYQFVMNNQLIINHNPSAEDDRFIVDDSWFGIRGLWFKSGRLTFAGTIDSFTPVTQLQSTREEGILFNPGGFHVLNYQLTNRLSIGSWFWFRTYLYGRPTTAEDYRADYLFAPTISYKVKDWYSMDIFYQINGESRRSYKMVLFEDDSFNFKHSFRINKYLTFEPMITLFRGSNYNPSKGNFNAWFSGTIF